MRNRPSAERRTSFRWQFQDYHRVQPQLHPRHRLRRIHLFLWIQQKYEVTRKLHETVAKELGDTATWKIFRSGWRSPQIIWRAQKCKHLQALLNDSDPERPIKVASRKHSICIHFPEDRNCEVRKRTKITRGLCRRRTADSIPRAEKFGDLIAVDHKALNEESESRHKHRYSIVVQDLATQWIQSYLCRT